MPDCECQITLTSQEKLYFKSALFLLAQINLLMRSLDLLYIYSTDICEVFSKVGGCMGQYTWYHKAYLTCNKKIEKYPGIYK